jgi:hypothetical protein
VILPSVLLRHRCRHRQFDWQSCEQDPRQGPSDQPVPGRSGRSAPLPPFNSDTHHQIETAVAACLGDHLAISGSQHRRHQKRQRPPRASASVSFTCTSQPSFACEYSLSKKYFVSNRGQFRPGGETPAFPGQSGPFGAIQRLTSNVIHSKFWSAASPLACQACLLWPQNRATSVAVRLLVAATDLTARLYLFTRCPTDLCFARLSSQYIAHRRTSPAASVVPSTRCQLQPPHRHAFESELRP